MDPSCSTARKRPAEELSSADDQASSEDEQDNLLAQSITQSQTTAPPPPQMLMEQDRFLPIANIGRLMKAVVPEQNKVTKEAKECVQECVSEFIAFVTSEASERCQIEKRKTISGEDILFALQALGLEMYVAPLKVFLNKYREAVMRQSPVPDTAPPPSLVVPNAGSVSLVAPQSSTSVPTSTQMQQQPTSVGRPRPLTVQLVDNTQNTAPSGQIQVSGPNGEQYTLIPTSSTSGTGAQCYQLMPV